MLLWRNRRYEQQQYWDVRGSGVLEEGIALACETTARKRGCRNGARMRKFLLPSAPCLPIRCAH